MRFTIYDLRFTRLLLFVCLLVGLVLPAHGQVSALPASQAEVNAGVIHSKFVAPDTLAGSSAGGANSQIYWVGQNTTQLAGVPGAGSHKFTTLYDVQGGVSSGALSAAGPGSIIYVLPGSYTNSFAPFRYPGMQLIGLGQPSITRSTVCNGINWTNAFPTSWRMLPWISLNDNITIQGINFTSFTIPTNVSPSTLSSIFIGLRTPSAATQPQTAWIGTNLQQILAWNPGVSNEVFGVWPEFLFTNRLGTNVSFINCNVDFSSAIDLNYIQAYNLDAYDTNDVSFNTPLDVKYWGNCGITYNTCTLSSGWDINILQGPVVTTSFINNTFNFALNNTTSGQCGAFSTGSGSTVKDIGGVVNMSYLVGGNQSLYLAIRYADVVYQDSALYKNQLILNGTQLKTFGTNALQYVNFGSPLNSSISGTFIDTNGYLSIINSGTNYFVNNGVSLTNIPATAINFTTNTAPTNAVTPAIWITNIQFHCLTPGYK